MVDFETIATMGLIGVAAYLVFKKDIDQAVSNATTPLKGDGNISIITPVPDVIYNVWEKYYNKNVSTTKNKSDLNNTSQKASNLIKAVADNTSGKVKKSTDKNSTYKGFSGVLTVQNQSYSVRQENAVIMAKQVYNKPKTAEQVFNIKNPYSS